MPEEINHDRRRFVGTVATAIVAVQFGTIGSAVQQVKAAGLQPIEGELPSLGGATGWLNSQPLTAAGLRGKVVLIDFWTYSCINWLRSLPYVRAWSEKYRDRGLVVIGVHTPEFPFEKDIENVRHALKSIRVDFPIAIDNDYAIWRAFNNYWPALYFIDTTGRIRHHHFGEGAYEQSEKTLQKPLSESGKTTGRELVSVDGLGVEAAADWSSLKSPENYLGYGRTENFASPDGLLPLQAYLFLRSGESSISIPKKSTAITTEQIFRMSTSVTSSMLSNASLDRPTFYKVSELADAVDR